MIIYYRLNNFKLNEQLLVTEKRVRDKSTEADFFKC